MNLESVPTLAAVPAAEWDHLARDTSFYLSHRWLAGEETDPSATCTYLLVRDPHGRLTAAAPLYLVHDEPNTNYRPEHHLDVGQDEAPRVIAGARRGYHNAPLLAPGLDDRQRAGCLTMLRDAAREHAARQSTWHWWPYLTDRAATELGDAYGTAPRRIEDDATISLPGTGFDDYLAALPAKRRSGIRGERRAFDARALTVRTEPLANCVDDAGRLLAILQCRHGHVTDTAAMTGVMRRQAQAMGEDAQVTAAYDGATMVAFSLVYHFGNTAWLRAVGHDPQHTGDAFEYFNLAYYLPIEDAYRHGCTHLHAGMKSLAAKRARGAHTSPLWALADPPR
ncbi:GNAT family N-acetyltransferase [Streptomyces sp. So13.3]|uniref:GNAT family N-acetyltransferase n=1 Tax=Streptomyces TaxID=1883 RepID=UPI0011073EAE|nr:MULTISPECIES: GNAT family N-acetyltransferase [Streptomyces]MCZ4097967.1 GNAT family N-acetyltransferase [Streptomyces sp. H39-C1]QNA71709.1 GNAT family N-acetyltransferase [Streptomyces sp. So13.3]